MLDHGTHRARDHRLADQGVVQCAAVQGLAREWVALSAVLLQGVVQGEQGGRGEGLDPVGEGRGVRDGVQGADAS